MRRARRGPAGALAALLLAALLAAAPAAAQDFPARFRALAANAEGRPAPDRLRAAIDLQWERTMAWYPEWASDVGWPTADHDAWTDQSMAAIEARRAQVGDALPVLDRIARDSLSEADRLNYDLFRREIELDVAGLKFPEHLLPIDQLGGVQQGPANLLARMPARTVADYDHLLARLDGLPEVVEQTIALLRAGLAAGVTHPRIALRDVPDQVGALVTADPLESPLLEPFREIPETIPEPERARFRRHAFASYEEGAALAFERLRRVLVDEYLPGARETIGASALPDGEAWYAHRARVTTTTGLIPQEIHAIGISEVERIRGEMARVIESTGFAGDFPAFLEFLRTDPRFFHADSAALLRGYRDIAKRVDPELPRLFGHLPRLPYGVKAIPAFAERSQTTAYYQPGSPETGRPGWFYANTYAVDTRPTWEMAALTLHEGVPGHHLQIAIAQELEDVPEFRRHGGVTAFIEGWGLYSESLGEEIGLYDDPYAKFGQLTYEMWRAVRLVVDTGMHTMGWDRQRAIDFFAANSSKSLHDITVEIDRYIVWPGQALAYKIGELKIKELRALAEAELGEAFDVRAFHDVVLGAGSLPLDVLEARVKEWIASQRPVAR